jgi:hypothetical protein
MTDLAIVAPPTSDLAVQMEYAKAVAVGDLLPVAYRGNPANVLLAIGLGRAMGLSPAESLMRIDVIQGKPTAAAELIASNVRKAGHRLRVKGDDQSCTATIIRSDDPDFEYTVTRDVEWAQRMGLASKDNYKKQPGTMLQWRAITAVARLACSEALYGVAYTPDEVADNPTFVEHQTAQPVTVADFLTPAAEDTVDAEVVEDEPDPNAITDGQRSKMFALFREAGIVSDARTEEGKKQRLDYIEYAIGRRIESTNQLTKREASVVIEMLISDVDARDPLPIEEPQ